MQNLHYVTLLKDGRRPRWSILNRHQNPRGGVLLLLGNADPEERTWKPKSFEQSGTTPRSGWVLRPRSRGGMNKFTLSDLSWTADGYTVQFRLGVMDIVKTAVELGVFEDSWRMDRMLDWVGLTFQSYSPL
jgi:hypothetical protein